MPFIRVSITKDGATPEQKAEIISEMTRVMVDVLDKDPQTTMVVIDEVETDSWGVGGETVTLRRSRSKS